MNFNQEILRVLVQAGSKGLKLENIARHVYNSCNSMFMPLNYKDVYNYVKQYLNKYAKDSSSLIEKSEKYGVYHLNFHSQLAQQYAIRFAAELDEQSSVSDKQEENVQDDGLSLTLF